MIRHVACLQVPLIWWPWWPFNPADFFLNSVLELERLQRQGIIDRATKFVPILDGLERAGFHEWFLAPFTNWQVLSLSLSHAFPAYYVVHTDKLRLRTGCSVSVASCYTGWRLLA
jgi:hypothetical protein